MKIWEIIILPFAAIFEEKLEARSETKKGKKLVFVEFLKKRKIIIFGFND